MINYKQYEKQVYDWLMQKHEADSNFTFSVRLKASKGAELDYFIGTQKSNYFATTFWTIPVGFPGSSGDAISLIFRTINDNYHYDFEFHQTNSPNGAQNRSALNVMKAIKSTEIASLGFSYVSPDDNRMFGLKTKQRKSDYNSLAEMFDDIDLDLAIIIPAVNKALKTEKNKNPSFKAHRITQEEFDTMQKKLVKRLEKYQKKEIGEEESNSIREKFSKWLTKVESSKKAASYIRAIDILNELLQKDLYTEKNITKLTLLYQDLIENQKDEKGTYFYAVAPSYGNNGFYSASIKEFINFTKENHGITNSATMQTEHTNAPINQILYGPPGTGKTYETKEIAVALVDKNFKENFDITTSSKERRKSITDSYNSLYDSGQIVFTTFHQSMSYEDFVEGIKPKTLNDNVTYDIEDGVFKLISDEAKKNWVAFNNRLDKKLTFDDAFDQLKEDWEEDELIKFPMKTEGNYFTIIGFTSRSIQFKKASGGTGHTLSINTLKEGFDNKRKIRSTGVGIYYPPIIERLKKYRSTQEESLELKQYVIIIDEINRGNVSAIFGELITLLEQDKRIGESEELKVKLPYSKLDFGVPPNLHIVGTMNTADRSVEALDTALRRRFIFKEVKPKPELLEEIIYDNFNLKKVLKRINKRIEVLLDRDHSIGHSYFISLESGDIDGLSRVFENSIIPLLQEYFYNDYEKIALVLGSGFIEEKKVRNDIFPKFDNIDVPDIAKSYELISPIVDIEKAVSILLGKN